MNKLRRVLALKTDRVIPRTRNLFSKVVRYRRDNGLAMLQADKKGEFVITPVESFQKKGQAAINKILESTKFVSNRQKEKELRMLENFNPETLKQKVYKTEEGFLEVFITGKMHIPTCSLRANYSERATRQSKVVNYLQRHLSILPAPARLL